MKALCPSCHKSSFNPGIGACDNLGCEYSIFPPKIVEAGSKSRALADANANIDSILGHYVIDAVLSERPDRTVRGTAETFDDACIVARTRSPKRLSEAKIDTIQTGKVVEHVIESDNSDKLDQLAHRTIPKDARNVSTTLLAEARKGFLGIGKRPAKLKLQFQIPFIVDITFGYVQVRIRFKRHETHGGIYHGGGWTTGGTVHRI